jgi:hypothetical protein
LSTKGQPYAFPLIFIGIPEIIRKTSLAWLAMC